MKKTILTILTILILFVTLNVQAETYTEEDITLSIDTNTWMVFTRNNLDNNKQLQELGMDKDKILDIMATNDIYIDALIYDKNNKDNMVEAFLAIKSIPTVKNLHTYPESDINELGEELIKKFNADSFEVFSSGKYKWIYYRYINNGYNIIQYYTIINGKGYNILSQKTGSITEDDITNLRNIAASATFNIDSTYDYVEPTKTDNTGNNNTQKANDNGLDWGIIIRDTIIGAFVGGLIGLAISILSKRNKNM